MPVSNSTVRKRRRGAGDFVIPTDESRAAKYAARAASIAEATAGTTMDTPMQAIAEPATEMQLTQMLENSMTENAEEADTAMEHDEDETCEWKLWRQPQRRRRQER